MPLSFANRSSSIVSAHSLSLTRRPFSLYIVLGHLKMINLVLCQKFTRDINSRSDYPVGIRAVALFT